MVKKSLQAHDFLSGGPKCQYCINFGDPYVASGTITFNDDLFSDEYVTIRTFVADTWNTTVLGNDDHNMTIGDGGITFNGNVEPRDGEMRYNTEDDCAEYYHNGYWIQITFGDERSFVNP